MTDVALVTAANYVAIIWCGHCLRIVHVHIQRVYDSIILMYFYVMPAICLYFVFMPHIFLNKSALQSSIYHVFLRFMSWGAVLWWLTLVVLRREYSGRTRSIPWLLMAWLLVSPGHQLSWYWLINKCIKLACVTFVFHKQGFQLPVPYPG